MKCFNFSGCVKFPNGFQKDMPYNDTFKRKLNLFKFSFSFDFDVYENDTRKILYFDLFCGKQFPLAFIDYNCLFANENRHVVLCGKPFDTNFKTKNPIHIEEEFDMAESFSPVGVSLAQTSFLVNLNIIQKNDVFKWYEKLDPETLKYLIDNDISLEKQEMIDYWRKCKKL